MELAIALVAIFGLRPLFEEGSAALKAAPLFFLFFALSVEHIVSHRNHAKIILRGGDLHQTIEYRDGGMGRTEFA